VVIPPFVALEEVGATVGNTLRVTETVKWGTFVQKLPNALSYNLLDFLAS
jgi:hypothetical protein